MMAFGMIADLEQWMGSVRVLKGFWKGLGIILKEFEIILEGNWKDLEGSGKDLRGFLKDFEGL